MAASWPAKTSQLGAIASTYGELNTRVRPPLARQSAQTFKDLEI